MVVAPHRNNCQMLNLLQFCYYGKSVPTIKIPINSITLIHNRDPCRCRHAANQADTTHSP